MAVTARVFGEEITSTLTITEVDTGVIDADEDPEVIIYFEGEVYRSYDADDIEHEDDETGIYTLAWTPPYVGSYVVVWSFLVGGEEYEESETIEVSSTITAVSDSSEEEEEADEEEDVDIGLSNTCLVGGTFYDASGNKMQGVYVRFTPLRLIDSFMSVGNIASEITVISDANGWVSFRLVRGMKGTLAISGIGLVREVEVPDAGTITLDGLMATGDDILEVQKPQFTSLPRSS